METPEGYYALRDLRDNINNYETQLTEALDFLKRGSDLLERSLSPCKPDPFTFGQEILAFFKDYGEWQ